MKPPLTTEARPTPKTDAVAGYVLDSNDEYPQSFEHDKDGYYVLSSFARELEAANQVLTEALEEAQKRDKILTDAMCEVKATIEGRSAQPLGQIVAGCQKELCSL